MNGAAPGHFYFEACAHAGGSAAHPLPALLSMHPRYACDFLKPACPLQVRQRRSTVRCRLTVAQLQAFAHALRAENEAWLQKLSGALQQAGCGAVLGGEQAACAFGDVAVQLHWGHVSPPALHCPPLLLL
jgi:hypothetical protein